MFRIVAIFIFVMIATIVVYDVSQPTVAKIIYPVRPTPTIFITLPDPIDDRVLWNLIQDWRVSEGRSKYFEDERLCVIADDRVDDPYRHDEFIEKYSSYPFVLQENLSNGHPSAKSALSGWLNSPGHAETLRKPYKASCVRCLRDYCVQIFSNLDY